MKKTPMLAAAALAFSPPLFAQDDPAQDAEAAPSPNQIVDDAPASDWVSIAAEDLLVMTLAPDRDGNARQVVIQLIPAPVSQGWVSNIRTLARAGWYDGISVNRVQDNYVVQWGDANVDNPEATGPEKALPEGLRVMDEGDYKLTLPFPMSDEAFEQALANAEDGTGDPFFTPPLLQRDTYGGGSVPIWGWPMGISPGEIWPVHCYGMVGVGRSYSPDTGTGAELYTVIGHAPRHLDRNIALVGRVIEGIEHLSSLPRGTGPLGFYETAEERVPIQSIAVADDVRTPPEFQYLSTESETFARYADARANRRGPFFIVPAGGADVCNIPVPVRRVAAGE